MSQPAASMRSRRCGTLKTAALAAAVFLCAPLSSAQSRLSLAERVQALEARGQEDRSLELVNQIAELRAELASLRDLVEQQQNELESLKKRSRDQYLELDGRLRSSPPVASAEPSFGSTPSWSEPALPPVADVPPAFEPDPRAAAERAAAERAAYDQAFAALKGGNYEASARAFAAFLQAYPDGENAPNATYWLGESHYVNQRYGDALRAFQNYLSRYPNGGKAPDSLLKVGYCHDQLGDTQRAVQTLNALIQRYPDSAVAKLAQARLRAIQSGR